MNIITYFQLLIDKLFGYSRSLTHISIASFLWDIAKQCRPRPDAAFCIDIYLVGLYMPWFWPDLLSTPILCVFEQWRLWRVCVDSIEPFVVHHCNKYKNLTCWLTMSEDSGDAVYKHSLHCFLLERSIKIWQKWKIPPNIPYNRNGLFHWIMLGYSIPL